jgi:excisionase family DNA binding protein
MDATMPNKKRKKPVHRRKSAPSKRDILNVYGIAALLDVSTDTVYELLQSGELPGRKVGREWRSTRNAIMRWLEETMADRTVHPTKQKKGKDADAEAAALKAIDSGDRAALTKALQSGTVRVKAA